jgi:hypothetical protein
MRMCQHCGAGIPNYAGFCGECGQLVTIDQPATQERTAWMSHSATSAKEQTLIITEPRRDETTGYNIEDEETSEHLATDNEEMVEEEEEEKRRRNALLGFSLPLLGGALEGQGTMNAPMVQGTPPLSGAPTVAGTPPLAHGMPPIGTPPLAHEIPPTGMAYGMPPMGGTTPPLVLPGPYGSAYPPPHSLPPPHPSGKPPANQPSGCMVALIVVIVVPLIILASIITIGFTFLAPTLALNGDANVATGDLLHLHGGHFIPGDSVTCVLDGSIVLSHASLPPPTGGAHSMLGALVLTHQSNTDTQLADTNTTLIVGSDGTFSATFVVGPDWKVGLHTIRATEAFSPRSATTTFTVTGNGQPTSTATSTPTVTATKTPTSTPTATPSTTTKPGLSAITPNILSFGPLSEGYTQTTSTQVLLNTTGTGLLNWTASWNTAQAGWLQLNALSGQVQEPNTQTLIVSAVVGALKAGTYNATILFSSDGQNGQQLSLPISLIVQAGCVKATPMTLNFAGTIGSNNPAAQTIKLNNCGAAGNWTEATTGGSWLLVSPTGGNLNNGATQNVLVSATLANVQSGPGTYQGQITFTNGPAHTVVNVIFTVQAAPLPNLGINITSFSVSQQCTFQRTMWRCPLIMLSRSGTATGNLDWTATSNSSVKITSNPANGTLQNGQTAAVEIDTPRLACNQLVTIGTVTFTGPANSATVTVKC